MECTCKSRKDTGEIIYCPLHLAAPDMYEALKAMLHDYSSNPIDDDFFEACLKARQAIAKVEGGEL